MTTIDFLLCLALVLASAFLSASEIAIFSLSRFQLRQIRDHFSAAHRRIRKLLLDPGGLLVTILVANEVVNVSLSTLIANSVSHAWSDSHWAWQTTAGILFTTPILLFACEITPKSIGARVNQLIAPLTAGGLYRLHQLLTPIRFVVQKIISMVSKPSIGGKSTKIGEDDFIMMLEKGQKEGNVDASEVDLIKNIFELDDTQITDVFTPLHKVISLTENTPLREIFLTVQKRRISRIPVLSTDRKQVVGIMHSKDALKTLLTPKSQNTTVDELMRKPFLVQSTLKLSTLFHRMKKNKVHLAVVTDEMDRHIGIITMDDVLEEIFQDVLEDRNKPA